MLQEGSVLDGTFPRPKTGDRVEWLSCFTAMICDADAPVAIKVLKPEVADRPEVAERLRHEAYVLSHLQHPNIVRYVDFQPGSLPYLVMAWAPGEHLSSGWRRAPVPIAVDELGAVDARLVRGHRAHAGARGRPSRPQTGQHHHHARRPADAD